MDDISPVVDIPPVYTSMIPLFLESIRTKKTTEREIRRSHKRLKQITQFIDGLIQYRKSIGRELTINEASVDALIKEEIHPYLRQMIYTDVIDEENRSWEKIHTVDDEAKIRLRLNLARDFFKWVLTHTKGDEAMKQAQTESVSVNNQEAMPQQKGGKGGAEMEAGQKASKQIKLTIYPDKALEEDIRLLAGIDGIPVSKFILKVIMQEVNNRRDDLNVIRSIRAKRG